VSVLRCGISGGDRVGVVCGHVGVWANEVCCVFEMSDGGGNRECDD
jgi:hypothetical protein